MVSTHKNHALSRFQTDLEAEKARKKRSDENPSAFEGRKQQAARDAIVKVAVIPSRPGSAPPSPPGGIFLGTGSRFPDNLPCPAEVEIEVELELGSPAAQDTSADNILHEFEQDIRGFGAQLVTAADPRDYATDLGDDLEQLDSSGGS